MGGGERYAQRNYPDQAKAPAVSPAPAWGMTLAAAMVMTTHRMGAKYVNRNKFESFTLDNTTETLQNMGGNNGENNALCLNNKMVAKEGTTKGGVIADNCVGILEAGEPDNKKIDDFALPNTPEGLGA